MKKWLDNIFMWLFIWSGSKLYTDVFLWPADEDNVQVVHFGISEDAIKQSCKELLEDTEDDN